MTTLQCNNHKKFAMQKPNKGVENVCIAISKESGDPTQRKLQLAPENLVYGQWKTGLMCVGKKIKERDGVATPRKSTSRVEKGRAV
jgi:hypothetical protein